MESEKPTPLCCLIGCGEPAEWRIRHGDELDEYTESCCQHIGELLTDAYEHRIYPISAPVLEGVRRAERQAGARLLASRN